MSTALPEPWLRGTHTEVDAVARGVLHALELAEEDVTKWCEGLSDAEMNARPFAVAPVAFHLRHIARSLDRLLSYAEGVQLEATQMAALRSEMDGEAVRESVLTEFRAALRVSAKRVQAFSSEHYNDMRAVGRAKLPTTVGGLLVHCADHTLRHVGQTVTTAKIVKAMRS